MKNNYKIINKAFGPLAAAICFLFFSTVLSGAGAGSSAANFLKLGTGARPAAMGDASAAAATGVEAIYWNPAGIFGSKGEVLLSHTSWVYETSIETAGAVMSFPGGISAGVLVNYFLSGSIDRTDNTGLSTGTYSNSDLSAAVCVAVNLASGLPAGISIKYINSSIDGSSASAFAADLGIRYELGGGLNLGVSAQNIGTGLRYSAAEETLPLNIRAGLLFKTESMAVAGDVDLLNEGAVGISGGAEYGINFGAGASAALRAGYRYGGAGSLSGLTAGAGIGISGMQLDYAYITFGEFGANHRISLKAAL